MTIITEPMPYRSIRVLLASIDVHEQLLKQTWEGSEEHWRIQRTLAALGRQLDEAERVWKAHHDRAAR
jgi:hypothetical protein